MSAIGRPIPCPNSGWRMRKGDIRFGEFACPGCQEKLALDTRCDVLIALASLPVGILISYRAGISGTAFLLASLISSLVITSVTGFMKALLWPKLVRSKPIYGV